MPINENTDLIASYLFNDLKNSLAEITAKSHVRIKTVFFGGGTPSLMSPASISSILDYLNKNYDLNPHAEITLEANPATFSKQKLKDFKSAGINRLSLGIQSFQDKNLKFLGRIYNADQAIRSAETISEIFKNYSFDFMYGYETQSIHGLEQDLQMAVNFGCPHISCYQLTIEQNTPFFEKMRTGQLKPITETQEIEYFHFIGDFLRNFSIKRYEISNYAADGYESRHNLAYWNYEDYLGIGPSAHSRITTTGYKMELQKFYSIDDWSREVSQNRLAYAVRRRLSVQEQLEEIFIMGLRLTDGISISSLTAKFPPDIIQPVLKRINFLAQQGLICDFSQSRTKLTAQGLLKTNAVIDFLFS